MQFSSFFGGRQGGILVRCLRRTFAFFFVSHLLVIVGNGQEIQPSRLTQMKMDHHPLSLNYGRMDQCMLGPGQQKIGSYGLLFRYPNGYLCPNEGLLICYPSQLDGHKTSHGIRVARPYQVANREDSEIARQCQAQLCRNRPAHCANDWHGIRVYTAVNMSTILELSITNRRFPFISGHFPILSYVLGDVDRFWLALGKKDNLTAVVHVLERGKHKHRIRHPDKKLRQAYFDHVGQGAFLGNYPGLWMLGVDILPMEPDDKMLLYINRSCQCTIEAWLTHPTDEMDLPDEIPLETGSNQCKNIKKEQFKNKIGSMETNEKITIWLLAQRWTDSVEIVLECEEKKIIDIKINKTGIKYAGVVDSWDHPFLPESNDENKGTINFLQTNVKIRVEIQMHEFNYKAIYDQVPGNDVEFVNLYFPSPGQRMEEKLGQCSIRVDGNAVVGRIEKKKMDREESDIIKTPYSFKLAKALFNNSMIRIRGIVPKDADNFKINLMHDTPEWHEYIGATVMQMRVNLVNETIEWKAYTSDKNWYGEEVTNSSSFPFKRGKTFDCKILVTERKPDQNDNKTKAIYTVRANDGKTMFKMIYRGTLPIWTINWLWFTGQVKLLTTPLINYAQEGQSTNMVKQELPHLLFYNESLCIVGNIKSIKEVDHEAEFAIYLFHEANEFNVDIGDTLLKLNFTFKKNGDASEMGIQDYLHARKNWQGRDHQNNPLGRTGQPFSALIKAKMDKYEIFYNKGTDPFIFPDPDANRTIPPPWTVNWITVDGDVKNIKIGNNVERCGEDSGQKELPNYIRQVDPEKPLKVGDSVVIQGTVKKGASGSVPGIGLHDLHISINFFREAVDWDPIIGQTVFQANITKDSVHFNTYYKEWKAPNSTLPLHRPLKEGQQFMMEVTLGEDGYKIKIGSNKFDYTNQYMPYWAIQYIVVKYDLEALANNEPFIHLDIAPEH